MTPRSPGSYRRVAIAVVVVAVLIGSGIDLTIARTVTSSSSTSTFCTIPDDGELLMNVLNSTSGEPAGSLPVEVENYYPNCISPSFRTASTNSSGMLLISGISDDYILTVSYHSLNFTASTYIGPGTLTCVTFAVPSGDLEISHSQGGESNCETSSTSTESSTQTTTTTTPVAGDCITEPGRPLGAYLRVLYDSNSSPVVGANVTATPWSTFDCYAYRTIFTTNGTEWYSLNDFDTLSFQITVTYLGHDYNLTMSLGLSTWTCETLYLPSGNIVGVTSPEGPCDLSNASGTTTTDTANVSSTSASGVCPSNTTCASFTYSPTGQVQVLSVQATQYFCQNCGAVNGQSYLAFQVALENIGNSSIYIAGGTDELSVSIPANSSLIRAVPSEVCAGTFTIIMLGQGQNYTLGGPPCDDGLDYQLVQPGTVNIAFRFDWTTNSASNTFPDSTAISAEFTLA